MFFTGRNSAATAIRTGAPDAAPMGVGERHSAQPSLVASALKGFGGAVLMLAAPLLSLAQNGSMIGHPGASAANDGSHEASKDVGCDADSACMAGLETGSIPAISQQEQALDAALAELDALLTDARTFEVTDPEVIAETAKMLAQEHAGDPWLPRTAAPEVEVVAVGAPASVTPLDGATAAALADLAAVLADDRAFASEPPPGDGLLDPAAPQAFTGLDPLLDQFDFEPDGPPAGTPAGSVISGSNGADALLGGGEDDVISGFDGDDRLIGGGGDDLLAGGTGADSFIFVSADTGNDRIADYAPGEDLIEFHAISGVSGVGDVSLTQDGADAVLLFNAGSVRLEGVDGSDLQLSDFVFL